MSTEIVLTDEQIGSCICGVYESTDAKEIGRLRLSSSAIPIGRAIEQPVLQSEQVQAWKKDAELLQAMAAEWDRARRGIDSHMPIWDELCEAIGSDADGAGMRAAINSAMERKT